MISKLKIALGSLLLLVNTEAFSQVKTLRMEIPSKLGPVTVELHGKVEDQAYLERALIILEEEATQILDYFEYPPTSSIHMIVDSSKTVANGLTRVFPHNHITYYRHPPVGEGHLNTGEEFLRMLVLHEFVHVVHLDQTRDFPKLVRNIFGSVGKIVTSIVPRWFTEGIATWAETRFTKGGRVRLASLRRELNKLYVDPYFCPAIDCIDEPGEYPYGQHSYWVGGDFMNWLEEKKVGTVKCLVHENSMRIPFFLNRSFSACLPDGKNAEDAFLQFRSERRLEVLKQQKELFETQKIAASKKVTLPSDRSFSWQQGSAVIGNHLFAVTQKGDLTRLTKVDLSNSEIEDIRVDERIHFIQPPNNTESNNLIYSASTYHDDDSPRTFYKLENKGQSLDLKGDYLFNYSNKSYRLIVKDKKWQLFEGENVLQELPELFTINTPRLIGDRIYFISYHFDHSSPYQIWSMGLSKSTTLMGHYHSNQPIHLLDQCGNDWFIKKDDQVLKVQFNKNETVTKRANLPDSANIAYMRGDYLSYTQSPNSLIKISQSCQNIEVDNKTASSNKVEDVKFSPLRVSTHKEIDSYPSFRHFLPHYWMIGFVAGTSADGVTATTGLNDPMEKHFLSLTGKYYTELEKKSGDFAYTYKMDWFDLGLAYLDFYSKSYLKNTPDKNKSALASISKSHSLGPFDAAHSLSYSESSLTDILSERETKTTRYMFALNVPRILRDDFLQYAYADVGARFQETRGVEDFWGSDASTILTLRPALPFYINLKASYSKFYKDGLRSGGIFGGGADEFLVAARHSYLGLSYNDAFGNEVWTARAQGEFELTQSYRGWGLFPLFMKRFSLVFGGETLHADFIYLSAEKKFISGNQISNLHAGVRFDMTVFYLAPIEYELLYIKNEFTDPELKGFLKASVSF